MIELIDITDPNAQLTSRIIATMLHSDRTIPEIADEFRLTFAAMMALLETPHAKAEIEAIGRLSALRDQLRAPIRRETALHRLAHIVAYSLNEPEARRAATTLIKAQSPPPQRKPKTQDTPEAKPTPERQDTSVPQATPEAHHSPPSPEPLGTPSLREGSITTAPTKPVPNKQSEPVPMCDVAMSNVPMSNVAMPDPPRRAPARRAS
ncbi:MAG: hypothetical protein K2X32_11030 [Phycisphaerales bacterium]|nr:hypothetical protein [Phycisphaerales bacterium]